MLCLTLYLKVKGQGHYIYIFFEFSDIGLVIAIDVANVQNVLYNFWKERILLRSF